MIRISWFLVSSLHNLYTLKSIFPYFYTILPDSRAPSVERLAGRVINLVVETDQLITRCEISHFTPVRKSEPTVQVSCWGVAATDAARANSCNVKRAVLYLCPLLRCNRSYIVLLSKSSRVVVLMYCCSGIVLLRWILLEFPIRSFSLPPHLLHSYTSSLTCTFHLIQLRPDLTETKNKGIGDAGSTADFRMLWSAMVCLGLL